MRVLSLFDGISCARVALERAGFDIETYYASEIDKYAIQVSLKNYPDIIQVGGVTELVGSDFQDIDLMIGGSPCQDLSIAKQGRKGLDGERSGLFWEYVRLLDEVRPKYFILENVNSMPSKDKSIITEILGVNPIMINASLVSAQNRKRLFWTNMPNITQPKDRGVLLKDILQLDAEVDDRMVVDGKSFAITASHNGAVEWNSVARKQRTMVRVGQLNKGGQGDRIYSTEGKSVNLSANGGGRGAKTGLYAVAVAQRGRNIVEGKRKDMLGAKTEQRIELGGEKANIITKVQKDSMVLVVPEATKKGYAIAHEGDSVDLSFPSSRTRRGRVGKKAKNIMTSQNIGVFTDSVVRKLTPIECERLQGLDDNYTEGISNTQRYKCCGNAFNADVVCHIVGFIKTANGEVADKALIQETLL